MAQKPRPGKKRKSRSAFGAREPMVREVEFEEAPKARPRLGIVLFLAFFWVVFVGGILASHFLAEMPDTANLLVYEPAKDVTLLDVKGRVIAKRGLTQGETVSAEALPAYVGNAFIAAEDRRFRSHFGIDLWGLARAFTVNLREGAFVQGGSTLTQQLAKNLFLKPERTIQRKLDEAVLALSLEARYTKDQILTLYLNRVYFGAGVYGIEAASERFFGKPARELTLIEAAMLAGIVKAPSRYNPATSPDAAMERATLVLELMKENGFIDDSTRLAAAGTRPKLATLTATPGAGYFADYVMSLVPAFSGHANERLIVETTLDLDLQNEAEAAIEQGLAADGEKLGAGQAALIAMSHEGAVRALVGGRSYDESGFNRATDAKRQPGSAFKPFVYLTALERGHHPDDLVFDGPVSVGTWTPDNYEGAYVGNITLSQAFARSSNSAAVQLTREAGPATVVETARRLGILSTLHAVPSLALGTSEVNPLELTAGYAAFANGGTRVAPFAIDRIRTGSGRIIYRRQKSDLGRVMSVANNAAMTGMMRETVLSGTGKQAALSDRPVAGKTGTSQDYRDAWFAGFTADYVASVWIGNDNGSPMKKATGGGLPARIFKSFMTAAERDLPPRPLPGEPILVAAANPTPDTEPTATPSEAAAEKPPPEDNDNKDVIVEFEKILDKLF